MKPDTMLCYIRADANPEIGMGHVMRCLSIADALKSVASQNHQDDQIIFLLADESVTSLVQSRGFSIIVLGTDYKYMEAELTSWPEEQPDLIIVDSYFVTASYLTALRQRGCMVDAVCTTGKEVTVVYIDDLAMFPYPVDILVNYNAYADEQTYERLYQQLSIDTVEMSGRMLGRMSPKMPLLLLGPSYAPLRFMFQRVPHKIQPQVVKNVLLSTGGADSLHLALNTIKKLLCSNNESDEAGFTWHILLGALNQDKDEIRRLVAERTEKAKKTERAVAQNAGIVRNGSDGGIVLHENVSNMKGLLDAVDIAVSAAGSTLYEIAACGVPLVTYVLADNQIEGAEAFSRLGLAINIGDLRRTHIGVIVKAVHVLATDYPARVKMGERQLSLIDGKGAKRIVMSIIGENADTRVIFIFDEIVYTVSDVLSIYNDCKKAVDTTKGTKNELKALYELFNVKQKNQFCWSRSDVTDDIFQQLEIYGNSVKDRDAFKKEVRKARRKFIYWGDVDDLVYAIIENMPTRKSNRVLKNGIPRDRSFYNCMIALACDLFILESYNIPDRIKDDKLFSHKLDYDFVDALKFFSPRFTVADDLSIDVNAIFSNIYAQIRSIGSLAVFSKLCEEMAKSYNYPENRILVNNSVNTEFPALWHLALKALTDDSSSNNADNTDNSSKGSDSSSEPQKIESTTNIATYESLVIDIRNAITLLDANNEHDLNLLLPNQDPDYLEHLMKYSAVYDLHQYGIEGMLFLIERILCDFQKEIEDCFGETKDSVFSVIKKLVEEGHSEFLNGKLHVLSEENIDSKTKRVIDRIASIKMLNKDCITPAQWDKVNDDSEWIIKNGDKYYVLPPILSMLGIYDKIGLALDWRDFGPQIETAVKDLFASIKGLNVYSGKYLFENGVFECDAIVLGSEYALIIECKRKGISRKGRGGDKAFAIKDIAETYFSSQRQAYHTHRAILENSNKLDLYPSDCDVGIRNFQNFASQKQTVDFSGVKSFIRISCTGGNFWIAAEEGINRNIEEQVSKSSLDNKYISDFVDERDKLFKMSNVDERTVKLDKKFISFDKLYDLVTRYSKSGKSGDALLKGIWQFTRVQDKNGFSTNNMAFISSLGRNS